MADEQPADGVVPITEMRYGTVFGHYMYPRIWFGESLYIPRSGVLTGADFAYIDLTRAAECVFQTTLSVGIAVAVSCDGLIAFDFANWEPGVAVPPGEAFNNARAENAVVQRIRTFNAHLACLHTAMANHEGPNFSKSVVVPDALWRVYSLDNLHAANWIDFRDSMDIMVRSNSNPFVNIGANVTSDFLMHRFNLPISIDVVAESFTMLDAILSHASADSLNYAELLLRACVALEQNNYSLSVILSWAVIESVLNHAWTSYVDKRRTTPDGITAINSERRQRLLSGRDYTASVVTEILMLAGVLPLSLYSDLASVRNARNKWMHNLKEVLREDADRALRLSQEMIANIEGVAFALRPGGGLRV